MRKPLAAAVLLLALAQSAWASSPAVPKDEQQNLKTIMGMLDSGDLAYVPTLLPANYEMTRTQTAVGQLTLTFTNKKYPDGSAKATKFALNFAVEPYNKKIAACANGSRASQRYNGKTVYMNAQKVAWRCVRAPSGHLVVLYVNSLEVSYAGLVRVVASAVPIS